MFAILKLFNWFVRKPPIRDSTQVHAQSQSYPYIHDECYDFFLWWRHFLENHKLCEALTGLGRL